MSKIAAMTLLDREDSSLSPHFGKAKWIMIRDPQQSCWHFLLNQALNGKGVVEELLRQGCTDVICSEIGAGAVENLKRAQIHGWLAPASVPASQLFQMLAEGLLQPASATKQHGEGGDCCHGEQSDGRGHSAGGCGCQHRNGDGHSGGCCAG